MKQLLTCVFFVILNSAPTAMGMNTFHNHFEQSNNNNPLTATINETTKTVEFVLADPITNEQGLLTITDETGNIFLEVEVEVLQGQIFKTIPVSKFTNYGNGIFNIVLVSENMTFSTTISI